jgi:predicted metal-dependent hydrolase
VIQSKNAYIEEVGNVIIRKSRKARYINITIKSATGIFITVPYNVSYDEGLALARKKKDWIKLHLEKIKTNANNVSLFDEDSNFSTRDHKIEIQKYSGEKIDVEFGENLLKIKYPQEKDIHSAYIQKSIRLVIEYAYRKEAEAFLPQRIKELSLKFNLPFNRLFIKNIKSRWGSCSFRNNINLSIHLMRLPDNLIDYVILHELSHTVVKNHSKNFWLFLDKLTGNAKLLDKELKNYRILS